MNKIFWLGLISILNLTSACTTQKIQNERFVASDVVQWQVHPCPDKGIPYRKYKLFGFDSATRQLYGKAHEDADAVLIKDKPENSQAFDSVHHFLEEKGILAACPSGSEITTAPPTKATNPEKPTHSKGDESLKSDSKFVRPITVNVAQYYAPLKRIVGNFGKQPQPTFKLELTNFLTSLRLQSAGRADELVKECPSNATPKTACFKQRYLDYSAARRVMMGDPSIGDLRLTAQGNYEIYDYYCQAWKGAKDFKAAKAKADAYPGPGRIVSANLINTEHTWPQSKFPEAEPGEKTDLHHIFPTDTHINGIRGNWDFAEVNKNSAIKMSCSDGWIGEALLPTGLASVERAKYFEPPTAHKGNVARALFYFSVRYNAGMTELQETYLRKWNLEDPPDESEKKRNDAIYNIIGIRNPFVDHPQWAKHIDRFCRVKVQEEQDVTANDCP